MKQIPGYSNYLITEDGKVFSKHRNDFLTGSTNPAGYHNFRLTGDDGYTFTWGRHRLLGLVFKAPNADISGLYINHINGIKGDDFLDNLEWVTPKENVIHAGENGLSEKCIPVSAKLVDTGEVLHFVSYHECGEYFNLTKDAISYRIKSGQDRVFPERVQYRRKSDSDWPTPDIEKALLLNSTSKCVLMKELKTGNIQTFDKLSDLARHLGISPSTVTQWMNIPDQPVLPGLIQLKWGHCESDWRIVEDPYAELPKAVVVRSERDGGVTIFERPLDCGTIMGIKPPKLHHRLKSKGSIVFRDGFRYWYYSDYKNSPTV